MLESPLLSSKALKQKGNAQATLPTAAKACSHHMHASLGLQGSQFAAASLLFSPSCLSPSNSIITLFWAWARYSREFVFPSLWRSLGEPFRVNSCQNPLIL